MNVFKKLKDVLFDVEEDEIPTITRDDKIPIKKDENPIKEIKIPRDDLDVAETSYEPIKPTSKVENKFSFPLDFEEEDELPIRNKKETRDYFDDEIVSPRVNTRESRSKVLYEEPAKKKDSYEYDYSRLDIKDSNKKSTSKPFKISPIISPVYGILDQNYTKDDVIVRSSDNNAKNMTIDEVRKKAYGSKSKKQENKDIDEFDEPLRTLDEILIDKEDVKKEEEKDMILSKNEPIGVYDDELPDEPYADEVKEENLDKEDVIESDLFNLIDSMYEERNEREEEE